VIAVHDRSTQTHDVMVDNSASSPNAQSGPPPSDDFYNQTRGLPTQEVTSFAESMSFRFENEADSDRQTGSELLLCGRCGAKLTLHNATVGRYRVSWELTPQTTDDVIESRERQTKASSNRTHSPTPLHHPPTTTDEAAAKVIIINTNNNANNMIMTATII